MLLFMNSFPNSWSDSKGFEDSRIMRAEGCRVRKPDNCLRPLVRVRAAANMKFSIGSTCGKQMVIFKIPAEAGLARP